MNAFQNCRNTSDAVPLYLPQHLYLKPIARIHISIQLPQKMQPGKSISNWEIMEKIRAMVQPSEFTILKVAKSVLEFIRFEAEIEDKSKLNVMVALLDGKTIKLSTFTQPVKVRAAEAKLDYPNRHSWDSFFRDAKNMNEMKYGERPDTVHISNLPIIWFIPLNHENAKDVNKPSQKIFQRVFETFGKIRIIDIPICDPYRNKMKEHITGLKTFTFDQDIFFEGYVQYKDHIGFTRAMDAFRGMKLLRKDHNLCQTVNIKVDFDKSKHLSDAAIRRRHIVREKLMMENKAVDETEESEEPKEDLEEKTIRQCKKEKHEDKERRRREREERRKARFLAQITQQETEELQKKIKKEEKRLDKAVTKLQGIRLLSALFTRIKDKMEQGVPVNPEADETAAIETAKMIAKQEKKIAHYQERLIKIKQGNVLQEILSEKNDDSSKTESSSDSEKEEKRKHKKKKKKKKHKKRSRSKDRKSKQEKPSDPEPQPGPSNPYPMGDPNWFNYLPPNIFPHPSLYGIHARGGLPFYPGYYPYHRGRGMYRGMNNLPGPSRGAYYPRRRGTFNPHFSRGWRGRRGSTLSQYTPEMEQEYYRYFRKFLKDDGDDDEDGRSYSRSRSRTRSRSRSQRRSHRGRSYSRSRSRNRSRTRSRSRSRNRSRTRSRSRSRNRSRNRSKSRSRNRSRSRSKIRSRNYSRSRSRSKSRKHSKSRSRSRSSRSRRHSSYSRKRSYSRNKSRSGSKSHRSGSKSRRSSSKSHRSGSKSCRSVSLSNQSADKIKSKNDSRSPSYLSIDSSKFISPSRLRINRSRSRSWSLPKCTKKKKRSWSRSLSPSLK